jgi:hypothetical protein
MQSIGIANNQVDGGYLSDVLTHNSTAVSGSELSVDNVMSSRILEKQFKHKYHSLRNAYEYRINQMKDVIESSCAGLFTDELLEEMKHDGTSSVFIPAHLIELFDKYLNDDREKYLHGSIEKLTNYSLQYNIDQEIISTQTSKMNKMEAEIARGRRIEVEFEPMKEKLSLIEKQYDELVERSEEEHETLKNAHYELQLDYERCEINYKTELEETYTKLEEKTTLYEELIYYNDNKCKDLDALKQSLEETVRDFVNLENVGKIEKNQLKISNDKLEKVTENYDSLKEVVNELKSNLRYITDELQRSKVIIDTKTEEEKVNRERVALLMSQVEGMLTQESSESNSAIVSMHDKLKQLRHKLSLELQREKRISHSLQEEVTSLRAFKEDRLKELRLHSEEETIIKSNLSNEIQKNSSLQLKIQQLTSRLTEFKSNVLDAELKLKNSLDRNSLLERLKWEEIKLVEDRAKLMNTVREADYEKNIYNSNQLRHSYNGLPSDHIRTQTFSGIHEVALKSSQELFEKEKKHIQTQHEIIINNLKLQYDTKLIENDQNILKIEVMQKCLEDASINIDSLKTIAREARDKSVIQKQIIDQTAIISNDNNEYEINIKKLNDELSYQINQNDLLKNEIKELKLNSVDLENLNYNIISQLDKKDKEIENLNKRNECMLADIEQCAIMEVEIKHLKDVLGQCQEQAIKDQAADANNLMLMQNKLHSLMKVYEDKSSDITLSEEYEEERKTYIIKIESLENIIHENKYSINENKKENDILSKQLISTKNEIDQLRHNVESNHINNQSFSPTISVLNEQLSTHQMVLNGVISGLATSKIITEEKSQNINLLLTNKSKDPDKKGSSIYFMAENIILESGNIFLNKLNDLSLQIESIQLNSNKDNNSNNLSNLNSTIFNEKSIGENDSEHSYDMLLDISKLDPDTNILKNKMEEMNKMHLLELTNLKKDKKLIEFNLRKSLEDELIKCRSDELKRTNTLNLKLKAEQHKRQQLQLKITEIEQVYNIKIKDYEKKIIILQIERDSLKAKYDN